MDQWAQNISFSSSGAAEHGCAVQLLWVGEAGSWGGAGRALAGAAGTVQGMGHVLHSLLLLWRALFLLLLNLPLQIV